MEKEIIFITGGAGYIGSHIAKHFLENDFKVVIIDNLSNGHREAIEILEKLGDLEFIEGDILSRELVSSIFDKFDIKAVIHCAALCSPGESFEKIFEYYANNLLGTTSLLEAMHKHDVKALIFSSSCAVYGPTDYLPVDEKHPLKPLTPYGVSKLLAEQVIEMHSRLYDMKHVIFRFFNVCGADKDGVIGDSKKPSQLLMQNAVRGALGIDKFSYTCSRVETEDGTPIRDYIDVEDLVRAHRAAYDYLLKDGSSGIFNLGSGLGSSVKEIVARVERSLGVLLDKSQARPRLGEDHKIYADISKAKEFLNWEPMKDIEKSIASLAAWYKKRPRGYRY